MEDRHQVEYQEQGISLGEYHDILRSNWLKIIGFAMGVGIVTIFWMFQKPNLYRATAIITPSVDDTKQNPALGVLASIGLSVGGPSKVEDLEVLFRSNDLTVRVFQKHKLWSGLLPDRFDPKTGKIKTRWLDLLFGNKKESEIPGDWDAIRAAQRGLAISVNKKSGTLILSFESPSPDVSADIVRYYLEEARSRLQEEAFERAARNKKFIEDQISGTVDALTRDRLYFLLGQEVEKEMLARNREQFGFRVIDFPRAPDRKSRPARAMMVLVAIFLGLFASSCYFLARRKESGPTKGA